jgi:hypothetical protein
LKEGVGQIVRYRSVEGGMGVGVGVGSGSGVVMAA